MPGDQFSETGNHDGNHRKTRSQSIVKYRGAALIFMFACAFMLAGTTTIESRRLSAVGMPTDAKSLQATPVLFIVLWLICINRWIVYCNSLLEWSCCLLGLYLASVALFGGIWLFSFRNTKTFQLASMPDHAQIQEIENSTKLRLSWMGDSEGGVVTFDNRISKNEELLSNALHHHGIEISQ